MLVLRSSAVLTRLDPAHGAEILDLVDLSTGRQLLGRPPFASAEPRSGALDEETWTASYRGGWQCVTPNAGNACDVAGERHGFHGRASHEPWAVLHATPQQAVVGWSGHGLEVTRTVAVDSRGVSVETVWRAVAERAELVAVEHLAVGIELLEPEVELRLPTGRAWELSEQEGPTRPPPAAPRWPEALLLDGGIERADVWPIDRERTRLLAVADLPEGRAEIVNRGTGQGLRLEWDARALPHMWIWHETRASGGPWRHATELLVVEPASVPHSLGLERALAEGQAVRLRAGEEFRSRITAQPFVDGAGAGLDAPKGTE